MLAAAPRDITHSSKWGSAKRASKLSKVMRTGNQPRLDVATSRLKVLAAVFVARKGHVKVCKT